MHKFKDLIVWQKGRAFVKEVYLITQKMPNSEQFGLTSQLRRASVSISANIAEGAGRNTTQDFIRFLDIANGSSFEVESHLYLCNDLGYINAEELELLLTEIDNIQKLLFKFKKHLQEVKQ